MQLIPLSKDTNHNDKYPVEKARLINLHFVQFGTVEESTVLTVQDINTLLSVIHPCNYQSTAIIST